MKPTPATRTRLLSRWAAGLATVAVVHLFVPQPVLQARTSKRKLAKRHFRKGKAAYGAGRFSDAIRAFQQAYRLWQHPAVVYNLALSHAMVGHDVRAAHFTRLYRQARPKRRLPRVLRRVLKQVALIFVDVSHPDARVYIDGKPARDTAKGVVVAPGQRAVDIRIGTQVVARRLLRVDAGGKRVWRPTISLVRRPPPRRPPLAPPRRAGPTDQRRSARVHWAWFATTAALALGTTIGAAVVSYKTKQINDEFLTDIYQLDLRDRGLRYERTANVLWGVSAGLAATAVLLAIFTRWRRSKERAVSIQPLLGPNATGLCVTFRQ